jgi:hypothetical protein
MSIQIIENREVWDTFVQNSPSGDIFHLWDFLKIMEKHSQYRLFTYGIFKSDTLIALAPMFYKRSFGLDFLFSPPPKTAVPNLGVIFDHSHETANQKKKEHILRLASEELIEKINSFSPNMVYISSHPDHTDMREFIWRGFDLKPRYSYFLDLNPDLDSIFRGFTRQRRQSIKKAEDNGLDVRSDGNPSALFEDIEQRYGEQGLAVPLINKDYLMELCSAFPQYLQLYTVEKDGHREGSILATRFKDVKLWVGSGSGKSYGNELLIWRIIQDAKQDHFASCEFVGGNTRNICRFKNQFNPSLKVYYEITSGDFLGNLSKMLYFSFMKKNRLGR